MSAALFFSYKMNKVLNDGPSGRLGGLGGVCGGGLPWQPWFSSLCFIGQSIDIIYVQGQFTQCLCVTAAKMTINFMGYITFVDETLISLPSSSSSSVSPPFLLPSFMGGVLSLGWSRWTFFSPTIC